MYPAFDIFQKQRDGRYVWHSAATTLDQAQARVKSIDRAQKVLIVNEDTGERTVIKPEQGQTNGSSSANSNR